jgi:quinol monooxygenase YgiN
MIPGAANRFLADQSQTAFGDTKEPAKLLRHVVHFKFKKEVTPEQIKEVVDAFRALPGKIDAIHQYEWGTDVSVENKSAGFTHCFFVTFRDEKGREVYLPHPAHQEFVKLVGPRLEDVLVVDYWTQR